MSTDSGLSSMNARAPGKLARFQDDFARVLLVPSASVAPEVAALVAQPAFAVYRNTVVKGCIDALQANYPAVVRLVGEEWFRAAAAVYVHEAPPESPMLLDYGAAFAAFLARFEPAAELPYLPPVARLDRLWSESHAAFTEDALHPSAIADLSPDALGDVMLRPHAAARWAWFESAPIYTIWSRNRADGTAEAELDWHGEGALLVRPHDAVRWLGLGEAGCAFLDACAAGGTLAEAAHAALAAESTVDIARLLATLLAAGAFSRASPIDQSGVKGVHP